MHKQIQEDNIKIKNNQAEFDVNYQNILNENKKQKKDKIKLKNNLQIFVDENKQCAIYINKLKDEIKNLNENSSKYLQNKEQKLTQVRYLSEKNEKLQRFNEIQETK